MASRAPEDRHGPSKTLSLYRSKTLSQGSIAFMGLMGFKRFMGVRGFRVCNLSVCNLRFEVQNTLIKGYIPWLRDQNLRVPTLRVQRKTPRGLGFGAKGCGGYGRVGGLGCRV